MRELKPQISPQLFEFFRQLKKNNNREWFQANKTRYEEDVLEPLLRFITEFAIPLQTISPHFRADARRSGGSLFRIYRDIRFSKDKQPYKTAAGIQFRHEAGKDAHAPGFYLHLEPDAVFLACGIWRPDNKTLTRIRTAIDNKAEEWLSIVQARSFTSNFEQAGESLQRPPKGFDPSHALIEDLKRKDFVAYKDLNEKDTVEADFINRCAENFRLGAPYVKFLAEALHLPF